MLYRCKFVTNSSSSSYVLQHAIEKLKEAQHFLFNARGYEDDDGRFLIPKLEELSKGIQEQIELYKEGKKTTANEVVVKLYRKISRCL
jgi:hypothetical protein